MKKSAAVLLHLPDCPAAFADEPSCRKLGQAEAGNRALLSATGIKVFMPYSAGVLNVAPSPNLFAGSLFCPLLLQASPHLSGHIPMQLQHRRCIHYARR